MAVLLVCAGWQVLPQRSLRGKAPGDGPVLVWAWWRGAAAAD